MIGYGYTFPPPEASCATTPAFIGLGAGVAWVNENEVRKRRTAIRAGRKAHLTRREKLLARNRGFYTAGCQAIVAGSWESARYCSDNTSRSSAGSMLPPVMMHTILF